VVSEEVDEVVEAVALSRERLALPLATPYGLHRHLVEVDQVPVRERLVPSHVNAAPELGLVPCRAAPGAAHLVGPQHDLDVVEPVED